MDYGDFFLDGVSFLVLVDFGRRVLGRVFLFLKYILSSLVFEVFVIWFLELDKG